MAVDRPLLWFACRHHIIELYAKAVWSAAFPGKSQCPGELLIKQFYDWWEKTDDVRTTFEAKDCPTLLGGKHPLDDCIADLKELCATVRARGKSSFPRGDYEELFDLLEVKTD